MSSARQWDIFCRVIDNFGDIGVCWRLGADLAARGEQVRLWVDDASALQWMAPQGAAGVRVMAWPAAGEAISERPGNVLIEAFGCEIAPEFIAAYARLAGVESPNYQWINLEYLSAEAVVEGLHTLPSPVMSGPGKGLTKRFFYPGFTPRTGGLIRETTLASRHQQHDAAAWRRGMGLPEAGELVVSLFCYEPAPLAHHLKIWEQHDRPVRLLVTPGRARRAVTAAARHLGWPGADDEPPQGNGALKITYLPHFTQNGFDELLWSADLNFVRGEDSLVRALWAGKPFVWQLYPQEDGVHADKLEAFLDALDAPASLRLFSRAWNGLAGTGLPAMELASWAAWARASREKLRLQDDLVTQLLRFVAEKR